MKLFMCLVIVLLTWPPPVLGRAHVEPWSKLENWTKESLSKFVESIEQDAAKLKSLTKVSPHCLQSIRSLGDGLKEMKVQSVKSRYH